MYNKCCAGSSAKNKVSLGRGGGDSNKKTGVLVLQDCYNRGLGIS